MYKLFFLDLSNIPYINGIGELIDFRWPCQVIDKFQFSLFIFTWVLKLWVKFYIFWFVNWYSCCCALLYHVDGTFNVLHFYWKESMFPSIFAFYFWSSKILSWHFFNISSLGPFCTMDWDFLNPVNPFVFINLLALINENNWKTKTS